MSLPDTIFIFALALVIFGPKKLPEIGRQIGKLVFEFRRASNEFKLQIDEELRAAEASDRKAQAEARVSAPAATSIATAEEAPESLTIRPPTTGTMVSTDSPTAGISAAKSEPVSPESDVSSGIAESGISEPGISEDLNGYLREDRSEEHPDQNQPVGEPIPNHHG